MGRMPRRSSALLMSALVAVVAVLVGTSGVASAAGDVEVQPIKAVSDENVSTTEYTVQIATRPETTDVSIRWSKPSCGTWTERTSALFRWTHPQPPCGPDAELGAQLISVIVTVPSEDFKAVCRYEGAGTGDGEDCVISTLGLATPSASPSPTATASPTPVITAEPPPAEPSSIPILWLAGVGVALVGALISFLAVMTRRRREAALDPCAPRHRRGMEYLASELSAYADQNREAVARAMTPPGKLPTTAVSDPATLLGDLWANEIRRPAAWASALGTDEDLIRWSRTPQISRRSTEWIGPEGDWRSVAEAAALRIVQRTSEGYGNARSQGWTGSVALLVETVAANIGSEQLAAAISANAFAVAAIATTDALRRLNEASEAAGCPSVPVPDVRFFSLPSDADPSRVGGTLLRHHLAGGEPERWSLEEIARSGLDR